MRGVRESSFRGRRANLSTAFRSGDKGVGNSRSEAGGGKGRGARDQPSLRTKGATNRGSRDAYRMMPQASRNRKPPLLFPSWNRLRHVVLLCFVRTSLLVLLLLKNNVQQESPGFNHARQTPSTHARSQLSQGCIT